MGLPNYDQQESNYDYWITYEGNPEEDEEQEEYDIFDEADEEYEKSLLED